jgi:hypothetical protein
VGRLDWVWEVEGRLEGGWEDDEGRFEWEPVEGGRFWREELGRALSFS